ncbi:MAG: alpha/beta fold hydrolase [Burkholderiales bacterium]|nr:alpha/beta fold hydrolase [Burkholderiales bacterium]
MTPYRAPWWLPGGHLQTIYGALALRRAAPPYRRVRWEMPDGDFIDFDRLDGPADAPLVVMFHGLEGSSHSHYATALMHELLARGWRGVIPHFRGCSGTPNRLPRAYHSGDADEIDRILEELARHESAPLFVAGVSLGGNALLKWLGREGELARTRVRAAAAVCPPLDLVAAGAALRSGFNRIYTREFLRTLKPKAFAKLDRFPGLFDRTTMSGARDFDTFDDLYTAPAHGYRGVLDYWSRASSKSDLQRIAVPTLVLSARNDPFLPARHLPGAAEASASVTLEQPAGGGHVGFVAGRFPGHLRWLPERLLDFFMQVISGQASG